MLFEVLTYRRYGRTHIDNVVMDDLEAMERKGLIKRLQRKSFKAFSVRGFEVSQSKIEEVEQALIRKNIPYRKGGF